MRARGTPDARAHPQPRAQSEKAHECSHHGYAASSGVPHAMVLTACFERPPAGEPLLPADIADLWIGSPNRGQASPAAAWREDNAPGPPTWAVRNWCGRHRRRRASRQAGETPHASQRSNTDRVHRIPPRVRDDRDPPLKLRRDERNIVLYKGMSMHLEQHEVTIVWKPHRI